MGLAVSHIFAYSVMQLPHTPHTPHAFSFVYRIEYSSLSIYVLIYHACACLCEPVHVCVCLALPRLMRGPNMIDENQHVCVYMYFMCAWTEICKRFRFTTRHNTLRQQQAATWQQDKKGRRRKAERRSGNSRNKRGGRRKGSCRSCCKWHA